ncbi:hypothetical protein MRX96_025084 [Rhipicephalus microplus]
METYDVIVNQPVVIDNGSGVIKAGFAGDQVPKCHFPNFIGRPKHKRVMAGALEGDIFVGPKAEEHRGLLSIRYPMEHGIVTDWNDMERIWQYIYSKEQLQTFSEEVWVINITQSSYVYQCLVPASCSPHRGPHKPTTKPGTLCRNIF